MHSFIVQEEISVIYPEKCSLLGSRLVRELKAESIRYESKKFPDGEKYVRIIDEVRDKDIVVLYSMFKSVDEDILEFIFLVKTLRDLGASRIIGVIPYFPYARQDRRFLPGEAVTRRIVAELFDSLNLNALITVDVHRPHDESMLLERILKTKVFEVSAMGELAKYIVREYKVEEPIVIGPDRGGEFWARKAASAIGAEYDYLVKKRISAYEVKLEPKSVDVEGRSIIIVDDIISTGGTMAKAVKYLLDLGAKEVYAASTHGLLIGNAVEKIFNAGAKDLVCSDTIPSQYSKVSVAGLIADVVRRILQS